MPKIRYVDKKFGPASVLVIERSNAVIAEYTAQGFGLTLRQLYYQHVARGYIPNREAEYKRLGGIISGARLAGLVDWDAIQDRTRSLRANSHWDSPADIIESAAQGYRRDLWAGQPYRPEVWIEKDALVGVIEDVCSELDVPYFSCRGYTSQSEMWVAGRRMRQWTRPVFGEQQPIVFHLGDHDPSGIDMTRDITDRLELFTGGVELHRLALNIDQVREHQPPPNPAKTTDSRYASYIRIYGDESWELDALNPPVIAGLVRAAVEGVRDNGAWEEAVARAAQERARLKAVARRWGEVEELIGDDEEEES